MRKLSLLIAVLGLGAAACDEDNPARHLDGGTADSPMMIDAPVTPQPVTVTVKSGGIGQEGVVVHFQNADSTLVATEMTDATGVASHLMNAGGYVTAIDPFPIQVPQGLPTAPSHDLRTFAGVKPGDHLRLEESVGVASFSMTMTLPPQTDGNISYYDVASTCGSNSLQGAGSGGSNPSGLVYFSGCASADILVTARDSGNNALSYFFVANEAVAANGTLDYTAKTFSALATRTYNLGDQPTSVFSLDVKQQISTTKGQLTDFTATASSGSASTATVSFPNIPNGLGVVEVDGQGNTMRHIALDWGTLTTTAYTTDFAARMLIGATAQSYDATTHAITWTEASGVAPVFTAVDIRGSRNTNVSTPIHWQVVAPYTAATTTLPTLPVGDFDYNFTSTDPVNVNLMFGKVPGGYDTVRAQYFAETTPFDISMGAAGSAQFAMTSSPAFARTKPVAPKKLQLQHRTQSTR